MISWFNDNLTVQNFANYMLTSMIEMSEQNPAEFIFFGVEKDNISTTITLRVKSLSGLDVGQTSTMKFYAKCENFIWHIKLESIPDQGTPDVVEVSNLSICEVENDTNQVKIYFVNTSTESFYFCLTDTDGAKVLAHIPTA